MSAFEFARQLNEISPVLIIGFFLPEIVNPAYELPGGVSKDKDELIIAGNINRFTELCEMNKIGYRIHLGSYELCMPQLIKEARFSDLFIACSEIFHKSFDNKDSHYYLNKALHESECPVIVVPKEFDFPEDIILAYDGSASSIYAIKQFIYLFPGLCNNNALMVYPNNNTDITIPHKDQIEELISAHFSHLEYLTTSNKYFKKCLANNKKSLLVTGSSGRPLLAEITKKSFAKKIIEHHTIPVFIAHN